MGEVRLTEAERKALRGLGQGQVPAVVEAILAARLAPIEALADEWDSVAVDDEWDAADRWSDAPAQLRASLTAAAVTPPSQEERA